MDIFDGIILGVVQGLTEFLPVSSTGHLILARQFLGLQSEFGLAVDAVLHLATALAVLVYFRKDFISLGKSLFAFVFGGALESKDRTMLFALAAGTIPAVIAGLLLEEYINTVFRNTTLVAGALVAGSALFVLAEWFHKNATEITPKKGFYIGLFQALALIPGISRSGAVISGGLLFGLKREEAARFGFLLAFPIIVGAGSKKLLELGASGFITDFGGSLLVAALAAFLAGMAAIHFLITFLRTHTLYPFVIYRLILAAIVLFWIN